MIIRRLAVVAAIALAWPHAGAANDSSAELVAGGLVLTRNDVVEMREEDLFISPAEVRVLYRFHNTSAAPVTLRVAFPMPDVGGPDLYFVETMIPNRDDPANILDFRTTVDGRPVKAEVEQRAFAGGVDRTAWLKTHGLPLAPYLKDVGGQLDRLPKAVQDEAVKLELAIPDEYDDGQGMKRHLAPAWTLKTTFHWEQTFPAGRDLVVEHRYTPSVGTSAGTMLGSPYSKGTPEVAAHKKLYCIDEGFMAAVDRAVRAAGGEYAPFFEARIGYILTTGGNWKSPIGDFRLVIDKGAPENLVSFCAEGVKKISPTRFEVRRTNWRPDRDLSILILKPVKP